MSAPNAVAVIGGGASGSLTAINLARRATELGIPIRVHLVERAPVAGPGIAYRTTDPLHLMNTPVGKVSAYSADPEHLLRWVRRADPDATAGQFLTRTRFGQYLRDTLTDAFADTSLAELVEHHDIAMSVREHRDTVEITLAGGGVLRTNAAVLALGNSVTAHTPRQFADLPANRYLDAPWLTGLGAVRPGDAVLLLGTGLTMVDIASTLLRDGQAPEGGPATTVLALSRHGLLPTAHATACRHGGHSELLSGVLAQRGLTGLVRAFREAIAQAPECWRDLVDALRPHSFKIWEQLPVEDRQRFLVRFGRFWDTHRHRLPTPVAERIGALLADGRLVVRTGTPTSCRQTDDGRIAVTVRSGRTETELTVDRLVNCAGFGRDVGDSTDPLLRDLVARGVLVADELRLGVRTDHVGRLVDSTGTVSPTLATIGPLRRGTLFETTAIPEIRDQAAGLAERLLGELGYPADRERPLLHWSPTAGDAVPTSPGELVATALAAVRHAEPAQALMELQRTIAEHRDAVLEWLPGAGLDELLLYAGPELTVLRVEIGAHTRFPPHDHQIPAHISVLRGVEVNTYYRRDRDGLHVTGVDRTAAGSVTAMTADAIHAVSNHHERRSVALHIYPGDLFGLTRTIWDLTNRTTHPYSDRRYFAMRRAIAPARETT